MGNIKVCFISSDFSILDCYGIITKATRLKHSLLEAAYVLNHNQDSLLKAVLISAYD
jgi:hypothetical protein